VIDDEDLFVAFLVLSLAYLLSAAGIILSQWSWIG